MEEQVASRPDVLSSIASTLLLEERGPGRVDRRLRLWRSVQADSARKLTAAQMMAVLDCLTFALTADERESFYDRMDELSH